MLFDNLNDFIQKILSNTRTINSRSGINILFSSKKKRMVSVIASLLILTVFLLNSCFAVGNFHLTASKSKVVLNVVTTINLEDVCVSINCMSIDEEANLVYVGTLGGPTIILDGDTGNIVGEFPRDAYDIWINNQMNRIIVKEHNFYVYDLDTNDYLFCSNGTESDDFLTYADSTAYNPNKNLFYSGHSTVTQGGYDEVRVTDGNSFEILSTINIPKSYEHKYQEEVNVAVNPTKNLIYAGWTGGEIFLIDGSTYQILKSRGVNVDSGTKVQINPVTNYVYLSPYTVLNGETFEDVKLNEYQGDFRGVDTINNIVYTSTHSYSKGYILYAIDGDTHELLGSIDMNFGSGEILYDVVVNSSGGKIYVQHGDSITVLQKSIEQIEPTVNAQENNILFNILISVGVIILLFVGVWFFFIRKKS